MQTETRSTGAVSYYYMCKLFHFYADFTALLREFRYIEPIVKQTDKGKPNFPEETADLMQGEHERDRRTCAPARRSSLILSNICQRTILQRPVMILLIIIIIIIIFVKAMLS